MSTDAIQSLSMSIMNAVPAANQPALAPKAVDVAQFQAEFEQASRVEKAEKAKQIDAASEASKPSEGVRWISEGLNSLKSKADGLAVEANKKVAQGEELKPKDMLMLTVHAHEFLFHCELTSNVANRTSDGITQLFRQQS